MKHEFVAILVNAPQSVENQASSLALLKARSKRDELLQLSAEADLRTLCLHLHELSPVPTESALRTISGISPRSHVLVAGDCSPAVLDWIQTQLHLRDCDMHVLVDALTSYAGLKHKLEQMQEKNQVQIGRVGALRALLFCDHPKLYAYNMLAGTGSLIVIVDAGTARAKVLLIRRKYSPYRGFLAIPGGFIKAYLENLLVCGDREKSEECHVGVDTSAAVLIGENSDPDIDPRGHFINTFHLVCVPAQDKKRVLASVQAGDDAAWAGFVSVEKALACDLAFNHQNYLRLALAHPLANSFGGVLKSSLTNVVCSAWNNIRARIYA